MDIEDILEDKTPDITGIMKERKIAINCIISTDFCKGAKLLLQDLTLFDSTFVRTILRWCMSYYETYNLAPNTNIQGIYEHEKDKLNQLQSKEIGDFLESLSDQFVSGKGIGNTPFELDVLERYLKIQQIKKHQKKIEKLMLTNDVNKVEQEIANYNTIKQVKTQSKEIMDDFSRYDVDSDNKDFLFRFPGAFGQMLGDIKRGQITMVGAEEKVGKSREMVYFLAEAYRQGLNVFVMSLEMSQHDMELLIDKAILMASEKEGEAYIPQFTKTGDKYKIGLVKRSVQKTSKHNIKKLWEAERLFNPKPRIRVKTWPQETARVYEDLVPELDILRNTEDFVPDVVIVDYADLMKPSPEDLRRDKKYQIMTNRRDLKRFAQEWKCHVHTATQMHADLSVKGDKDKGADVDFLIGLHQTPEEKSIGVYHIKCLAHRHVPFNKNKDVTVLSNNGIGQFYLDSKWDYQVDDDLPDVDADFSLFVEKKEDVYDQPRSIYDYI